MSLAHTAWIDNEISDAVRPAAPDFKIEREDRVRSINGVLTEGRIDTRPTNSSTILEP